MGLKPQLPPRCARCADRDWVYAPNGGAERCDCSRGQTLAAADTNPENCRINTPGVTLRQAALAVEEMAGLIKFVPESDVARLAIARELAEFVWNAEEIACLVRQAGRRYRNWPGILELRALYCSMFHPRDGVSAVFEGDEIPQIPSERVG